MSQAVLITGGAGFIGQHLARRLLREGCQVTILDNFNVQVHGGTTHLPPDLASDARLIVGDVRDQAIVRQALAGQTTVVHLAAETGTGQSMYAVEHYSSVNLQGTSILFDCLVNEPSVRVEKIVVASSRAVYGEGQYHCPTHGTVYPEMRGAEALRAGQFELTCPRCGGPVTPVATDEEARLQPVSFYGLTKLAQEKMTLLFARALDRSGIALRYQNVYGPGQSLTNPYTGLLAVFANRARAQEPIYIFEDGQESRDFVYIEDVVEATWRAIRPETTGVAVYNVGGGERITVLSVAQQVVDFFHSTSPLQINGAFRVGDIRHNLADLHRIQTELGYTPRWRFADGIEAFLRWAASSTAASGPGFEDSLSELRRKGLLHDGA